MTQTLPLYRRPVLLHRDTHRDTRLAPLTDTSFGFARSAHSLPLTAVEFTEACKEYPVVFARDSQGQVLPVLLLGLRDGENLFVDADGRWTARYVPAFVRRYPFVLAQIDGSQLGVCIDQAWEGVGSSGDALFDEAGADTPFLAKALEFLHRYQAEHERTRLFCERLSSLGLLQEMNARADLPTGASFTLQGLMIVDEQRLLKLPDDSALALLRSGELAWIYSHLVSVANLRGLIDRLSARA